MSFLGIDLGTGGVRCTLACEDGAVLAETSCPLSRPNLSLLPGESEQDPSDWITSLEKALDELFSVSSNRTISSVSVDSTSGTVLPIDSKGRALGPALLHNDVRSLEEARECEKVFAGDCSPTFSLPKILWMRSHLSLPDDVRFFHAADFLNAWLMGSSEVPTDFTNALKTGVDLESGEWPKELAEINLPKIVRPGLAIGELSSSHRRRWGLMGTCLLASGATDSNAAFYASGASCVGQWSTTIGTTLAVKGLSRGRIHDPFGRIYCHRHPDGPWLPGGASNAGGEILRNRFEDRIEEIESRAKPSSSSPPLVYPSVRKGERMPFCDAKFIPFTNGEVHSNEDFLLGCLEGLSFVEKMTYDLLAQLGAEVGEEIFVTGGASSSTLGMQMRADVLQKSLLVPENPHSAMGASILAAAGYFSRSVGEVSSQMVRISKRIDPRSLRDEVNERFFRFKQACPSIHHSS